MKYILFEITKKDNTTYYNKSWNCNSVNDAIKLYLDDENIKSFVVYKRVGM